jgi:hypothetical protein
LEEDFPAPAQFRAFLVLSMLQKERVMNTLKSTWTQVLFVMFLSLAACTPVEEPQTASISGGIFFDADRNGKHSEDEVGKADMCVRLYQGGCGENMIENHSTNEKGEFLFTKLAVGEYCVITDFELLTCGYGGNDPTTAISRHVKLENGLHAELDWFGFSILSGETDPEDN